MPSEDVRRIDSALSSTDRKVQATAMATEFSTGYLKHSQYAWPKGTTIKIDPATFIASDAQENAIVEAQTSTGTQYVFHLVKERGKWVFLFAEPVR